jgi:hypothetical protein
MQSASSSLLFKMISIWISKRTLHVLNGTHHAQLPAGTGRNLRDNNLARKTDAAG